MHPPIATMPISTHYALENVKRAARAMMTPQEKKMVVSHLGQAQYFAGPELKAKLAGLSVSKFKRMRTLHKAEYIIEALDAAAREDESATQLKSLTSPKP